MTHTTDILLPDDAPATPGGHTRTAGTAPRRRRRRRFRAAVLTAGLAAAFAGTACEPPPTGDCLGVRATIVGTAGDDTLRGTAGPDVITGLGGRDVVHGLGGNDRLCGGAGSDRLDGGAGNDVVDGGASGDVMAGGIGTDTIDFSAHPKASTIDLVTGSGPDGDRLSTFENVVGTPHGDHLLGDDGPNVLSGGRGSDHLSGGGGADTLVDQVATSTDQNTFTGGPGDDVMRGGPDAALDMAVFGDSPVSVSVDLSNQRASGFGEDELSGIDAVLGSPDGDTIFGSSRGERLHGNGGNDLLVPRGGNDVVDGMDGRDRVSYAFAAKVDVDLATGRAAGEGADVLIAVEDVEGSPGADVVVGDARPNVIDGAGGTDTCVGGGGADSLIRCP